MGALLLAVHACQDVPEGELPHAAETANKQITISGDGIGSGTVTIPPTAGRATLTCVITVGIAALNCNRFYPTNQVVTLTATPAPGHAFERWSGACSGTSVTCTLTMSQTRKVTATFKPPLGSTLLSVTGTGSGNGTVVADVPPGGINCTITGGNAAALGCSGLYLLSPTVRLTATAPAGHSFAGWDGDCASAGSEPQCELSMSESRQVLATFNADGVASPGFTVGRWSSAFTTPVVAVHMSLLPTGRVLIWGHTGEPWLWNPASFPSDPADGFTQYDTPTELFCSGHNYLPDGQLLVVGGHDNVKGNGFGLADANLFDGSRWQTAPAMAQGRWYPTATTLPNGEVLVTAGTDNNMVNVKLPEVWNGSSWRQLTSGTFGLPYYPRMFVAPNGKVFYAGEGQITKYFDPAGVGKWSAGGTRLVADRNYGSAAMVDGKVLYAGGGGRTAGCPTPLTETAELADLNVTGTPVWRAVGSMAFRRRQLNLTILADGKVLATGGSSACGFSNESGPVYAAESWNPTTEQWSLMAAMHVPRMYHSTAILLPDGRVLSAGGGDNGEGTPQFSAEVFTPPYLFNSNGTLAARPSYTLASTQLSYGQVVTVTTSQAASISKVTLIRLSSVTHAFNESQQLNTLTFSASSDGASLRVNMPASGNRAPPGPYMLFLINSSGVPSVARIVNLR